MTLESKAIAFLPRNDQAAVDTCPDLQKVLKCYQERYGRITTMKKFLHSEYNGLDDDQLKEVLSLTYSYCDTSADFDCRRNLDRPCQCLVAYRANGRLP